MDSVVQWMGGAANAQAVAAVASSITAAAAVVIAVWNGYITRKHAQLSVVPVLSLWVGYPGNDSDRCTVKLGNTGFGPALVNNFEVWHNGEVVEGFLYQRVANAIRSAFGSHVTAILRTVAMEKGFAFGANSAVDVADFAVSSSLARLGPEAFAGYMTPLSLLIRYQDIYERKWIYFHHEFSDHTYRATWWSIKYLCARFGHFRVFLSK